MATFATFFVMTERIRCDHCELVFTPKSEEQRYCSKNCRKLAARNRRLSKRDRENNIIDLDEDLREFDGMSVLDDA